MLAMGEYLGQEIVNIEGMDIPSEIINMISPAIAQLYRIIPLHLKDDTLTIVQADALNFQTMDDLRLMLKHQIKPVLCHKDIVLRALGKYYPKRHESVEQLLLEFKKDKSSAVFTRGEYIDIDELKKMADAAPVKKWVSLMFLDAVLGKASDIHLEPFEDGFKIRYRIDG